MNLYDLQQHLHDNDIGQAGKTLFCYELPAKVTGDAILLRDRLQGDRIDAELGLNRGGLQMIVRCKTQRAARDLAQRASTVLTLLETDVGSMHIKFLRPRTGPVVFPVSDGNYIEALVIFDSCYSYL